MISENSRGALMMMAGMASFVANDTCLKLIGETMPLAQLLLLRGVLTIALMLGLAYLLGQLSFRMARRDFFFANLRGLAEIAAAYFFLTALFNMPLANITAILQAMPLTMTMAGAVFFKEKVGWRRISAILAGFVGVILIVRPGAEGFNVYAIYGLLAVVMVTLRDLCARPISDAVPSLPVAIIGAVGVTAAAGIVMAADAGSWTPVAAREATLIGMASVFLLSGYFFSVAVMRIGEVSFTSLFRYTGLLWALLIGWLVFADWPDFVTFCGISIVVASGAFTFLREQYLARRKMRR